MHDETPPPPTWDVDVVLSSGVTARVRQIEPSDADRLQAFHQALSPQSRQRRYFTPMPRLSDTMLDRFVQVDHVDREALVVEAGDLIVGLGQYERLSTHPTDAEVAFAVADEYQGHGIGTLLLEHLASLARRNDIERFVAETLGTNSAMLKVFTRAGYSVHRRFNDGVYEIDFPIAPTTESERLRADREHRATVASISRLLRPASVAADDPRRVGDGFTGTRRTTDTIEPSTDVVVLELPPDEIADTGWRWADAAAGTFVVMSGGTGDIQTGGPLMVRSLVRTARRYGMRVLGPDAYGVVNTDPAVGLSILRQPHVTLPGRVGVFTDGPTAAPAVLDGLAARGIGISTFVGAGDKADISANDLLEYWEQDPATDVILLTVGSFGNPVRFAALARRISQRKPIVIVTPASPMVDALCRRTGVLRADSLDDLLDQGALLTYQRRWAADPPPELAAPEDVDLDAVRVLADQALESDHDGRPLDSAELQRLLTAAGLGAVQQPDGWTRVISARAHRDPLFGPVVSVTTEPGTAARVALTPLTSPDLHALTFGHSSVRDHVLRLSTLVDAAQELAEVEVQLTDEDVARLSAAQAAVAPPTGLITPARRLN